MTNSPGGLLTKSIVVLSLFLVSMGVSLLMGRAMGRSIMALTRSNIQQHFPGDNGKSGGDSNAVAQGGGTRTPFGFDAGNFAPDQVPRSWADPQAQNFSTVSDEPVVGVTVLPDQSEQPATGDTAAQKPADSSGTQEKPKDQNSDQSIFQLSNGTIFRIQVGTFQDEANAQSVWKRLTQAGYEAHIAAVSDADGKRFKVNVGLYATHDEADKVAEKLRSMNFDAWVYQEH
jgi:cell division protein FtsN